MSYDPLEPSSLTMSGRKVMVIFFQDEMWFLKIPILWGVRSTPLAGMNKGGQPKIPPIIKNLEKSPIRQARWQIFQFSG